MKRQLMVIVMIVSVSLSYALAQTRGGLERLSVLPEQGQDRVLSQEGRELAAATSLWQTRSRVLEQGAEYLEQYLRRRGLSNVCGLTVGISGVTCTVKEASSYGHTSYAVVYSLRVSAQLNGKVLYEGEVEERLLSPRREHHITEELRSRLVKRGLNQVVRTAWRQRK